MARRHVFGRMIVFCLILVLVTLIGGSWLLLERQRQSALSAADLRLQNTALIVESAINRQLLQIDGALASLPTLFSAVAEDGQEINAQSVGALLRGVNFQTFAFRDIIILRPDGQIWASARRNPWNGKFPGALINQQTITPKGTATVAGPFRNPVTGDWVLLIFRQVLVPGVGAVNAVSEVPLPLISVLFTGISEMPGLQISIERRDGRLLVSHPYDEMQVGELQLSPSVHGHANGIAFTLPKAPPRKARIGVVRSTLYPDIMIVVTLDLKTTMADWTRDRNRMIVLVTIAVMLLSALALTLDAARRQRDRADAERSRARATLDNAIESMPDGFVMWDAEDRLVICNDQYRKMYALSAPFLQPGAHIAEIIREGARIGQYPQMTGDIEAFVQKTIDWHRNNQGPIERELPNARWALISESRMHDGGTVGIRTDITDMRQALSNLAAANERVGLAMEEVQQQNVALRERDRALHIQNVLFDAALNNMSQGLLMTDRNQRLIVSNKRFLDLFAIDPALFSPNLPLSDVFRIIKASSPFSAEIVDEIYLKQRRLAEARQSGTIVMNSELGQSITISQRPIADGGWVATYEDVSEQRRAEERIRFAAHHDALTKLPNRVLFRIRVTEMIDSLAYRNTGLAVLYLDLDRFKHVNDTLGHPIGDALLEAAGRRLQNCLRDSDVVARLGGDEFAIAQMSNDLPAAAAQLGKRIIAALSRPYKLAGHTVTVGVSIGISLATDDSKDADILLKNADMALYQAKAKGRGICSMFEVDMERQLLTRLAIEEDLHDALERQEFELLYQPLWDLSSNQIAGFEALIRWNHPVRGTVSPAHFIPIAEETGMIHAIGAWVLHKACADAMLFADGVKIAINLSGVQFDNDNIVGIVAAALESSGLPARRLELEITETTLLKNDETTIGLLHHLHAFGLRIALDDFGTGYSSLSYLRRFAFDKIKIDQSFVREMATREDCSAIVSSVVMLANKLNITTTAEGIETLDQLQLIRETGCMEAQGYLFSVPRTLEDALEYLAESAYPLIDA
jgi:diguanylate cyclase (GGDEF)-like protein